MRWTLILALASALSTAMTGCAAATSAAVSRQTTTNPAPGPTPTAQEIDRAFKSAMVLHHTAAVEMARVEVQRGQRPDVKQLVQQIINAQEGEVAQLKQTAQQDFNVTPSTTLSTTTQQGMLLGEPILMNFPQQIDDLKATSDPDTMFLQMMIPHHAMAIVQADTQMMHGRNQRVKAISQDIISSQSRQIGETEDMLQHH